MELTDILYLRIFYRLSKIMTTIKQLLTDGANPKLVQCPQSALLIAVMSNSPGLVRYLVDCGANINENYHQVRYFIIQIITI